MRVKPTADTADHLLPKFIEWQRHHETDLAHSADTVANYRTLMRQHALWLAATKQTVHHMTPELLQRYAGEVLHARGVKPQSRRVAVSALRGYYGYLKQHKVLPDNPALNLPPPKVGRPLPVAIPLGDAEKLMGACDMARFKGVRDVAILSVLLGCGVRVSGCTALNEGDLLFAMNEHGLEELTLRLREKGKKERYVPAPDETRLLLRAYLGHPELDAIDRTLANGDKVLFVNLHNSTVRAFDHRGERRRMNGEAIWKMLQRLGARAKVDSRYLHPHAFRHLYGAELMEGDTNLLVSQMLMGHGDSKTTEIYSHIAYRKLRSASEKANPFRRIKTPATGLAALLRAQKGPTRPAAG